MTDATPVLYALIVFLAIVVAFLLVRLVNVRHYAHRLHKTLMRLEGEKNMDSKDDPQDQLGG